MNYVPAYYKPLQTNGHALIYNGTVYLFDIIGRFTGVSSLLPMYSQGAMGVNVISILSSRTTLEIGLSIRNTFRSFTVIGCTSDVLQMAIFRDRKYIVSLSRSGKEGDIRYTQSLFIYRSDIDLSSVIKDIKSIVGFKLGERK